MSSSSSSISSSLSASSSVPTLTPTTALSSSPTISTTTSVEPITVTRNGFTFTFTPGVTPAGGFGPGPSPGNNRGGPGGSGGPSASSLLLGLLITFLALFFVLFGCAYAVRRSRTRNAAYARRLYPEGRSGARGDIEQKEPKFWDTWLDQGKGGGLGADSKRRVHWQNISPLSAVLNAPQAQQKGITQMFNLPTQASQRANYDNSSNVTPLQSPSNASGFLRHAPNAHGSESSLPSPVTAGSAMRTSASWFSHSFTALQQTVSRMRLPGRQQTLQSPRMSAASSLTRSPAAALLETQGYAVAPLGMGAENIGNAYGRGFGKSAKEKELDDDTDDNSHDGLQKTQTEKHMMQVAVLVAMPRPSLDSAGSINSSENEKQDELLADHPLEIGVADVPMWMQVPV